MESSKSQIGGNFSQWIPERFKQHFRDIDIPYHSQYTFLLSLLDNVRCYSNFQTGIEIMVWHWASSYPTWNSSMFCNTGESNAVIRWSKVYRKPKTLSYLFLSNSFVYCDCAELSWKSVNVKWCKNECQNKSDIWMYLLSNIEGCHQLHLKHLTYENVNG